jgi:hypothetical protein
MSAGAVSLPQGRPEPNALPFLIAVALGSFAAGVLSVMERPLLAAAVALAAPVAHLVLRHPIVATMAVMFALYTNAGVVAAKYHGVPYVFAVALPLLLLVPLSRAVFRRGEKVLITPALGLLFLYALVQFASAIFATRSDVAVGDTTTTLLEGVLLYFLIVNAVRSTAALRAAVWALLAAGIFLGGLTIFQHVTGTYHNSYGGFAQCGELEHLAAKNVVMPDTLRHDGPLGEANRYAQIMAMLLPLTLAALWSRKSRLEGALAVAAAGVIGIACALTLSRSVMVGLALTLIAATIMGYVRARYLIAAALVGGGLALTVPRYAERLATLGDIAQFVGSRGPVAPTVDGAVRSRATEMKAAALMFFEHPVLGVGPGNYAERYQGYARRVGGKIKLEQRRSHSLYMDLAAETGVIGLGVFLAFALVTYRSLRRARERWARSDPERAHVATALLLTLLVFLTTSLFLHLAYARYFWMLMALAGAAAYGAPAGRPRRARSTA